MCAVRLLGEGGVAEDRYCRNCGQELQPEDQFCRNCGRPVHATAHVPAPEADMPVPPPPQAEDRSAPPQAPQARPGAGRVQTAPRGPVWGMLAVFLVQWVVVTVQERTSATRSATRSGPAQDPPSGPRSPLR